VTVRHAALAIGTLMVLGLGVYLFVEVRAQPAAPAAAASRSAPGAARSEAAVEHASRSVPAVASVPPPAAVRSTGAAPPPDPPPTPALAAATPAVPPDDSLALTGPRLDAVMDEANKAYDRGDFDDAKTIAQRLLARQPNNVRMLRIMVSASCIDGDGATAQAHYVKLPPADQAVMRLRCSRYGVGLVDRP
jgi:chemotaxis protein methyltransferase WspC